MWGACEYLGIHPDIAVFAKGIANGFPVAAIIGKKKFMDAAQDSFISSTFWTERIGFAAAIASIKKCVIIMFKNIWLNVANRFNLGGLYWQKT